MVTPSEMMSEYSRRVRLGALWVWYSDDSVVHKRARAIGI